MCTGCGRSNHAVSTCRFTTSPYFNSSGGAFVDSKAFKKLKTDRPTLKDPVVPNDTCKKTPTFSSSSSSATASISGAGVMAYAI